MDAKHEAGGSMEISLTPDDIALLRAGRVAETTEPTSSGLLPFVVMESHEFNSNVDASLFDTVLGVYVHRDYFTLEAIREAIDEGVALVTVPRNRMGTKFESSTNIRTLFGREGTIAINPPRV